MEAHIQSSGDKNVPPKLECKFYKAMVRRVCRMERNASGSKDEIMEMTMLNRCLGILEEIGLEMNIFGAK